MIYYYDPVIECRSSLPYTSMFDDLIEFELDYDPDRDSLVFVSTVTGHKQYVDFKDPRIQQAYRNCLEDEHSKLLLNS